MLDTDTPTTDQTGDTNQIEFAWMITLQYNSPSGLSSATRSGTTMADPKRGTRAELLDHIVGAVKNAVGVQNAIVLCAYLERNTL